MAIKKPTYAGTYDDQLKDLYQQITNRDKFSYDVNQDALYQQVKDQYVAQGKLASQDAMGQAASLTGGYGNSYAQSVGQQTYQGYLQQLNDVVPELHGMAYDKYQQEGQDLLTQYSMLEGMRDTEYQRYQDELAQYWQEKQYRRSSGGGSGSGDGDTGNLSAERIKQIQWSLGVDRTGVWDKATIAASGYKNSNEAYQAWNQGKIGESKNKMLMAGNSLNAKIKDKDDATKEKMIKEAYEKGTIDAEMAGELLRVNGLL